MSFAGITGLTIYPVKSMRGIDLTEARLGAFGLEHDRRWMVVSEDGRFVTQRDMPRLALVRTAIDKRGVTLSMNGTDSIHIPFEDPQGEQIVTKVWKDECTTTSEGKEASNWLTGALESNETLYLVRMAAGFVRPQNQPEKLGKNTSTLFADAAPFLVANEASLNSLNRELENRGHQAVPMNRFRPNITVRGIDAFKEHRISGLFTERYSLEFCHPCQRCIVTTIDQQTAEQDNGWQPYKTLRDINPMPGNDKAPAFAHNAALARGEGTTIAVGQVLTIKGNSL